MDNVEYIEGLIKQFRDGILDEYNNKNISKKEMLNIMNWANRIIKTKKQKRPK